MLATEKRTYCYMCSNPGTKHAPLRLIGEHWYCQPHEHYAKKYEETLKRGAK